MEQLLDGSILELLACPETLRWGGGLESMRMQVVIMMLCALIAVAPTVAIADGGNGGNNCQGQCGPNNGNNGNTGNHVSASEPLSLVFTSLGLVGAALLRRRS